MKRRVWYIMLGFLLVVSSIILYLIHYAAFRDPHHIFIYMLGDIAFLPIEILLVILIIHKLLLDRDKRMMMEKMNMVIGTFFSEVGTDLLKRLCAIDPNCGIKSEALSVCCEWGNRDFLSAMEKFASYEYDIESQKGDIEELWELLARNRDLMVRLLENQLLLEHETFTDLLWAVFHLTEELSVRGDLSDLPQPDREHLNGDISRVYRLLTREWFEHMGHLRKSYPYLFSLAIRLNPFDPEASPVFSE